MDTLYDQDGDRVHCATVLRIRAEGRWQWGRYEMDRVGLGYFVVDGDKCIDLDAVAEIDWRAK